MLAKLDQFKLNFCEKQVGCTCLSRVIHPLTYIYRAMYVYIYTQNEYTYVNLIHVHM